ncbi:MAG: NAD-dependent epimerase/dehydratase family protein [Nitrospira sp.]|nr:NAD-dependent epimerase/dehydratase family protein [Nitrospira sp.]
MKDSVWKQRRVLVTGCTGLLGSWLTSSLCQQQADVVGLVRDSVPRSNFYAMGLHEQVVCVHGSVEDFDLIARLLNEYEIEVVFHLAAQTLVSIANANPLSTFSSNIAGTWNVLEAVRRARRVRAVVLASSDKAYGTQERLPYREDSALMGRHPYDVSKSCADLIGQMYWHTYKIPIAITRCGNFYGGGDLNFNRIVPGTIRSLLQNERPVLRSNGSFIRDYFYIKDAVEAYLAVAEALLNSRALGEAYNFSNELQVTVMELVSCIQRLMGREELAPVILNDARNEIPHQYLDAEKARTQLGWKSRYTLEQGLQETIDWYRAFLANPLPTAESRL